MKAFLIALLIVISSTALFAQQPATEIRTVAAIAFTGNTVVSTEELLEAIPLKPGDILTQPKLEETLLAVQNAYKERGYLAAIGENVLDGFAETGTLTIPVIEIKIAEVRIEGLKKTKDYVVRRILEQKPGDIYNVFALRRDADQIQALNIFSSIDASIMPADAPDKVIIVWKLDEPKKTGNVQLGGSFSPSQRFTGTVTITESNLRGTAQRVGGTVGVDTKQGRVSGNIFYSNPWIDEWTSLDARAFSAIVYRFSEDLVESPSSGEYSERRNGALFTITKKERGVRQQVVTPRFENVDIENFPVDSFVPTIPPFDGPVFAVSGGYLVDTRDFIPYPTTGIVWRAYLEPGLVIPEGGSTTFVAKLSGLWARFYSLDKELTKPTEEKPKKRPRVVAVRLKAGFGAGSFPFYEQYFNGGSTSIRGYEESRFWGKQMYLGTVEYRQPLTKPLTAIAFVDVGDAWGSQYQFLPGTDTNFTQHEGISAHAGAGVGIRYMSGFGTLGVDFAWGQNFRVTVTFGESL